MSLDNATLQRVDPPDAPGPAGDPTPATPGPAIAVRCILQEPTTLIRWLIDDLQVRSTDVLYVRDRDYPTAAADLVVGGHVTILQDGDGAARRFQIDNAKRRVLRSLSDVQLLLREA